MALPSRGWGPVALVAVLVAGCCALAAAQMSTRSISSADLNRILGSPSLVTFYVNCLLGKGNCDRDGDELKRSIPQALVTGCDKCTKSQKAVTEKVIGYLMAKRPADWKALSAKYDPNGEYEKRYERLAKSTTPAAARGKKTGPKPTVPTTPAT